MKILLADDSMTAQNMGKKILTDAGFEVIAVSNGAAALKKITAENPDIIILDVFMPGYTGLEVCERLKNNPATSRKPVLLTVGKMEPFNPDDSNRVRAEGVMIKPFEATDLTAAVQAIAKRFNLSASSTPPAATAPKAPQVPYKSYEETVRLSQDEMRESIGIGVDGAKVTEAAPVPDVAAVAIAAPALEIREAAVEEPPKKIEIKTTPAVEAEAVNKLTEVESHKPFSHSTVAQQVVGNGSQTVSSAEPAAWDPVLDGIAISETVVTPVAQVPDAQPAFGMDEYVSVAASEAPAVVNAEPANDAQAISSQHAQVEEEHISSPNAHLAQASAAMELETSHPVVEEEPVVESTPDFEPNVAPPVMVETHSETGMEAGIEQPTPEISVTQDPALVGGTESFSSFTTHFGVENPEEIPVGIVPELMPDTSSSYEYQPPEEGHIYEPEAQAEAAKPEPTSQTAAPESHNFSAFGTPHAAWEMVPVESAVTSTQPAESEIPIAPATVAPEVTPSNAQAPIVFANSTAVESEAKADEAAETPFDPDATQPLPTEFFTSAEPELETTAELVGASIPEESETVVAQSPTAPGVEIEPAEATRLDEGVTEEPEQISTVSEPEIQPAAHFTPAPEPPKPIGSITTEPPVLSVGPEPPSIEPVAEPSVEHPHTTEEPAVAAAAAAAGAAALGAAITEHLISGENVPQNGEQEVAVGDRTQVFIASAVARVLDRMKPTLIEEIAREMSTRRKPRKDSEE